MGCHQLRARGENCFPSQPIPGVFLSDTPEFVEPGEASSTAGERQCWSRGPAEKSLQKEPTAGLTQTSSQREATGSPGSRAFSYTAMAMTYCTLCGCPKSRLVERSRLSTARRTLTGSRGMMRSSHMDVRRGAVAFLPACAPPAVHQGGDRRSASTS